MTAVVEDTDETRSGSTDADGWAARRFRRLLAITVAVGAAIRVGYIVGWRRDATVGGDPYYYHYGANLLADGHGFISPLAYTANHHVQQAADHPPLYIAYLALWSLIGVRSALGHMLASVLLGLGTIVLVGLAGRRIGGSRVGLLAAVIAAVYPNVWVFDGFLLSESMAMLMTSAVILAAYRYRDRATPARAAALGALVALAALSRAELVLLAVLVVVPVVLGRGSWEAWKRRLPDLVVAGVACVLVLLPWITYNITRFDKPVYLSAGFEMTLSTSTCDTTYYGKFTGYWSMQCALDQLTAAGLTNDNSDQSEHSSVFLHSSLDYIRDHLDRVPTVVLVRWGRITGLYKPLQQADLDQFPEGRERWVALSGLGCYYVLAGFAVVGVIALRRRRAPVYLLLAPIGTVLFAVTVTFAMTRYRASAEPALCLLAAVGIDALVRLWQRLRDDPDDRVPVA